MKNKSLFGKNKYYLTTKFRPFLIIFFILISLTTYPEVASSNTDLNIFFKNVFDNQNIEIPTGIYYLNNTINLKNVKNINIVGVGNVLIIIKEKYPAFNLDKSTNITFENIMFIEDSMNKKGEISYIFYNSIKNSIKFNGCLFKPHRSNGSPYLAYKGYHSFDSIFFDMRGSMWGESDHNRSIIINCKPPSTYRYSRDPKKDFTKIKKYGDRVRVKYTNFDGTYFSRKIIPFLVGSPYYSFKNEYGWTNYLKSKYFKESIDKNNKKISTIELLLNKSQFEKTTDYNNRIVQVKKDIIDLNLKYLNNLDKSIINFAEAEEAASKNEKNEKRIDVRKSIKNIQLKNLKGVSYDADKEVYDVSTDNLTFKCNIKPAEAKQLSSNFNGARMDGYTRQKQDMTLYLDLFLTDSSTGQKFPCIHTEH